MSEPIVIRNAEPSAWLRGAIQTALADAERGCDHLGDGVISDVDTVHVAWSDRARCVPCANATLAADVIPLDCHRCGKFVGRDGGLVRCEYPAQRFTFLLTLCRSCMDAEVGTMPPTAA